MTISKAKERINELAYKSVLSSDEEFELLELLEFITEKTKDYSYYEWIGGIYYGKKQYDLALKYYEMADMMGSKWAANGLGYIWYYGRTGEVNYEKAYHYFMKIIEGDGYSDELVIEATFKIADMYKNGYYVEKDFDKYKELIEGLYQKEVPFYLVAPVYTRLASIRVKEGRNDEAIDLYLTAKSALIRVLKQDRFFGDLNRMNWLVNDLYKLIEFDVTEFDIYDLYYVLKQEHLISFKYRNERYEIESEMNNEDMNIRFNDKWYRDISDFFLKAELDGESIERQYSYIEDLRIER